MFWPAGAPDVAAWPGGRIVFPVAVLALPLAWRRDRGFVALALLTFGAGAAFHCWMVWFEERYFLFTVPLAAVTASSFAGVRLPTHWGRAAFVPRLLVLAATFACVWPEAFSRHRAAAFGERPSPPAAAGAVEAPCQTRAMEWLNENTAAQDTVLTTDPWAVHWQSGRPAVMIPTGGWESVAAVARHYGARWVALLPLNVRMASIPLLVDNPGLDAAHVVFEDRHCRILRLGE